MSNRILPDCRKTIPHRKHFQSQLSCPNLSHLEQEYQKSLVQKQIHIQQKLNEGVEYSKCYVFKGCVIQVYLVYIFLKIWPLFTELKIGKNREVDCEFMRHQSLK